MCTQTERLKNLKKRTRFFRKGEKCKREWENWKHREVTNGPIESSGINLHIHDHIINKSTTPSSVETDSLFIKLP